MLAGGLTHEDMSEAYLRSRTASQRLTRIYHSQIISNPLEIKQTLEIEL